MRPALLLALVLPLTLGGCLAKTVVDVATAPVKLAGKGIDLATTSQSEADEKRGRALRKREAKLGELERTYDRQSKACVRGNQGACDQARTTYDQIQALLPTVPVETRR
nr:hypothetical protein [Altererythrobacter segetis]